VNPRLTSLTTETFDNYEGCLSVPDLRGVVQRSAHVRVEAWDRDGNDLCYEARGLTAGTHQHEVDHLDGRLFVDGANPATFTTWRNFDRHHKDAFAKAAAAVVALHGG
jgi:peptide deformylase